MHCCCKICLMSPLGAKRKTKAADHITSNLLKCPTSLKGTADPAHNSLWMCPADDSCYWSIAILFSMLWSTQLKLNVSVMTNSFWRCTLTTGLSLWKVCSCKQLQAVWHGTITTELSVHLQVPNSLCRGVYIFLLLFPWSFTNQL